MDLSQYQTAQKRNIAPAVAATTMMLEPYKQVAVSNSLWLSILRLLFEYILPHARKSAELSRDLYDAERFRVFPNAPRHDVYLSNMDFDKFVEAMDEVRPFIQQPGTSSGHIHRASLIVAKEIENTGRRTMIHAVQDPDPHLGAYFDEDDDSFEVVYGKDRPAGFVQGWARVPTGAETCAFCWALASRGAVYGYHSNSGLKISFEEALEKHKTTGITADDMNQWHTGCDCIAVPVFSLDDWPGKERNDAALALWNEFADGAGKERMNSFRRALEAGELDKYLERVPKAA